MKDVLIDLIMIGTSKSLIDNKPGGYQSNQRTRSCSLSPQEPPIGGKGKAMKRFKNYTKLRRSETRDFVRCLGAILDQSGRMQRDQIQQLLGEIGIELNRLINTSEDLKNENFDLWNARFESWGVDKVVERSPGYDDRRKEKADCWVKPLFNYIGEENVRDLIDDGGFQTEVIDGESTSRSKGAVPSAATATNEDRLQALEETQATLSGKLDQIIALLAAQAAGGGK